KASRSPRWAEAMRASSSMGSIKPQMHTDFLFIYAPGCHFFRANKTQTPRQIIIPNAEVALSTTAKIERIEALRISPRKTTANGPAKDMAKAGRQSCRGLWMISSSNSPNHGASRNHDRQSGKNAAAMRGKKDTFDSP